MDNVVGNCGKHSGFSMINCPMCEIEYQQMLSKEAIISEKVKNMKPKKQLRDYIHLYMNPFNKIKILVDNEEDLYLWDVDVSEEVYVNFTAAKEEYRSSGSKDDGWMVYNDDETLSRIKPYLRPLSSMTIEEQQERDRLLTKGTDGVHSVLILTPNVHSFKYLLDKHFDLFDLIPAGLAIPYNSTPPSNKTPNTK